MSIGAAIDTILSTIPPMPVAATAPPPPAAPEASPVVAPADIVEISPEGAAAAIDDQPVASVAAERLIFPYPFPNTEIEALLNNLRQRENLERQMFRLQDDAIVDREVGTLAAGGTSPDELRDQADQLRKENKHDEANELNQLAWRMEGRGIPEDDPATARNELEEAGDLLTQRADDKQIVASLIGRKLDSLEEDFEDLVENFDVDDEDDFHPPIFLAAAAEEEG
ncbi:MAG: hypothetical protein QGF00_29140 [Planctomycetota bacterium]|nr:hypothetical protein [Planctomycetota bacterium]MDP7253700.1 hypothetical protein [Planctomycetota bacterium]